MVEAGSQTGAKLLGISFNQDQGCFACATERGFKIFNSYPFKETFRRQFSGGISIVAMLYRSNILALVGGGEHPYFPPNKVVMWDDHQMKSIGELGFKTDVKGVQLRKDRIVVALEQRLYLYQMSDLKLLDVIDTYANPLGICALSLKDAVILLGPDKLKGHLRITNYETANTVSKRAHENALTAITLSSDAKMCATASEKGTLIRVFAVADCSLLQEVRRGADKADIKCIAFDKKSLWLACTSDKGTVHIFSLANSQKALLAASQAVEASASASASAGAPGPKNPQSLFKFMQSLIPYFKSEWSFAQLRIPDDNSLVAFGPEDKNAIIGTLSSSPLVVSYDAKYYLAEFDPNTGGDCHKLADNNLALG